MGRDVYIFEAGCGTTRDIRYGQFWSNSGCQNQLATGPRFLCIPLGIILVRNKSKVGTLVFRGENSEGGPLKNQLKNDTRYLRKCVERIVADKRVKVPT